VTGQISNAEAMQVAEGDTPPQTQDEIDSSTATYEQYVAQPSPLMLTPPTLLAVGLALSAVLSDLAAQFPEFFDADDEPDAEAAAERRAATGRAPVYGAPGGRC
jgi:hypothetical protein